MERFGYPDFFLSSADELIDGQYADRPQLRPIFDALIEAAAIMTKLGAWSTTGSLGWRRCFRAFGRPSISRAASQWTKRKRFLSFDRGLVLVAIRAVEQPTERRCQANNHGRSILYVHA